MEIGDNQRDMLFGTNFKHVYKVTLPEIDSRTLMKEKDKFNFSKMAAKYIKKPKIEEGKICSVYLGGKVRYSVAGDDFGFVTVWKDPTEIEENCGTLIHGHCGRITAVLISKSQEDLYSVGQDDETILQWKCKLY